MSDDLKPDQKVITKSFTALEFIADTWHVSLIIFVTILALCVVFLVYLVIQEEDLIQKEMSTKLRSFNEYVRYNVTPDTIKSTEAKQKYIKDKILSELDIQIGWEWAHERTTRRFVHATELLMIFINILIVGFSSGIVSLSANPERSDLAKKLSYLVAFLAFLNIVAPLFQEKMDFAVRQEAHDFKARQLSLVRTELEVGLLTADEAWEKFGRIHGMSMAEYLRVYRATVK